MVAEGDYAIFVGDYDTAIETFKASLTGTDDPILTAESNLGIGKAYYYQGNYGTGLDYLRAAAASDDSEIAARSNYLMGKTFAQLERYDEALAAFQAYLQLRPGLIDSHVHGLRGDLYNTLGDYQQAITSLEEAYRTDPQGGNETLAVKIAVANDNAGNDETALTLYQDIYNTSDNDYTKAQMDLLIGQFYQSRDEPEQAYAYFQDAVNNFPFAYDAYTALVTLVNAGVPVNEHQRGLINYAVGNYELAIEAFNRYLAEAPESLGDSALYYKALATRALGVNQDEAYYSEAVALWQNLIELYPASPFFIDAWEDIEYTQWAYMGEPVEAAETALSFVGRYPEDPQAPNFLYLAGRAYERAEQLAEAAGIWQRLADEYPNSELSFQAVYLAGIATFRLENWSVAEPIFARALVLATQPAETAAAYLWIGKCQEAQGDRSAALDSWKLAQTADPFGYYSIRAEDILLGRDILTPPDSYTLDSDLSPYRMEAESWLRNTFNLAPEINLESPGLLANDPRFQRGLEYWSLGLYEQGKAEFESIRQDVNGDPAQTFRLIPALVDIGLYRSALAASSSLLNTAGLEGADALEAPKYFSRIRFGAYYLDWLLPIAESEDLSPLLVLSIIRQESSFEGFISSGADARGLMQIIPATGEQIASELDWPENYSAEDLYRPYVSLIFGMNYLRRWRNYFEGDLYAMLASYNGGPGNTIAWKELAPDDPDLFLEVIRAEETRNYIRLITETQYIYRWLYGDEITP
jgi:soluble lytic murein transglycosylase